MPLQVDVLSTCFKANAYFEKKCQISLLIFENEGVCEGRWLKSYRFSNL